jgi:hypothetical protein
LKKIVAKNIKKNTRKRKEQAKKGMKRKVNYNGEEERKRQKE